MDKILKLSVPNFKVVCTEYCFDEESFLPYYHVVGPNRKALIHSLTLVQFFTIKCQTLTDIILLHFFFLLLYLKQIIYADLVCVKDRIVHQTYNIIIPLLENGNNVW